MEITNNGNYTYKKLYVVTYSSERGTAPDKANVQGGECAKIPTAPTAEGYTFAGWYLGSEPYDFNTPVESDLSLSAHWAIEGTDGDCTWVYDETNCTLTISGTGDMPDYTAESKRPEWEYLKDKIKKVVINEGITNAGDYAFYEYTALEQVSLPDSLAMVENSAFYNSGLTFVVIPKNVSVVSPFAFAYCSQLTKAYFTGQGFVVINEKAFYFSPLEYVVLTNTYFSAERNKSAFGYMGANKTEGFTIYAPIGSDDRGYAESNGFRFVALGNVDLNFDEDGNNIVDDADAALLLKYISGTAKLDDPEQLIAAKVTDPTKDKPDMLDVIAILNMTA